MTFALTVENLRGSDIDVFAGDMLDGDRDVKMIVFLLRLMLLFYAAQVCQL